MTYSRLTQTYTLDQLLDAFKITVDKLQRLRNKISAPNSDARQVALFGMQEAIVGFGLTIHAITGNGLRTRQRDREEVLESLTNYASIDGKNAEQLYTMMETVWRLSLLTLFHFRLDSLFQNILYALGQNSGKRGFGHNMQQLTDLVTLKSAADIREKLNIPTYIRNSLHNNGIHRGADFGPIVRLGLSYEFKKDTDIRCASFGHVLAALDATVDAVEEILLAPEVAAVANIEDLYSKLNPP